MVISYGGQTLCARLSNFKDGSTREVRIEWRAGQVQRHTAIESPSREFSVTSDSHFVAVIAPSFDLQFFAHCK
uniref:Uncharacterized protein n=1 Tax=Parascaris equorum TaxID=6256 RepID=A0A914RKH3_PAREQ